jgi:hypothetical protein
MKDYIAGSLQSERLAFGLISWTFEQQLQNRALRLITKSQRNAHTDRLFRQYKMLTTYKLNQLQVGCFMYKVYKKSLPQYFIDMFKPNSAIHHYNTRQCNDYHLPSHRLIVTSNSMRIFGVKIWNSICLDIKSIDSFSLFRTRYKLYLINI